jgi:Protein of unknown function (DUF3307)
MLVMAHVLDPTTVTRSVVFAVSLVALLVAHQLGDHVLQTDRQAAGKADGRRWWRPMIGHLVGYHATAAVVVVGTGAVLSLNLTVRGVVAGLAFSAVTHGLLDRRWPVRAILRAVGSPRFAEATAPICGIYAADQALHKLALLVSALLIASL